MKFYKDGAGEVWAFAADGSQDEYMPDGLTPLTAEEEVAHLLATGRPLTREQVESVRLAAYADPITGSDRMFTEALRLQAMGADQAEIDAVKAAGVARYTEIQSENPWPED